MIIRLKYGKSGGGGVNVNIYRNNYIKDFYPDSSFSLLFDVDRGRDILFRFSESNWWTWCVGSTLVFWRWPGSSSVLARFGGPVWIHSALPKHRRTNKPPPKNSDKFLMYLEKFKDVIQKNYIQMSEDVQSYMDVFHVEKTQKDIRMITMGHHAD